MAYCTRESVLGHGQLEHKNRLESSEGLPFRHVLCEEKVVVALTRAGGEVRERIYTPMVTLWAWLSQVISHKDASCEDAVGRVIADRVARKLKACSPDNSSYCTARGRLPEQMVVELTREAGQELHRRAPPEWLWKGRRVVIADGSTAMMADTSAKALMDSFAPHLSITHGQEQRRIEAEMLRAIAGHGVPERPGRKEPRAVKKRVQKYSYLTKPRTKARKQLAA